LRSVACASLLLAGACAVGDGTGWASGEVWAAQCGLDGDAYDLRPTFFAAEAQPGDVLIVRMQRGSDSPEVSDGILIQVWGASDVKTNSLGVPLSFADGQVDMTLYLNATCPLELGGPAQRAVAYAAVDGSITFEAIYAPELDRDETEIRAHFADVLFVDAHDPENLRAILSGELEFLRTRGRPGQPFP
jgi:hypothetical protein